MTPALLRTAALAALCGLAFAADASFAISQADADGIYAPGETVTWTVRADNAGDLPLEQVAYTVRRSGAAEVGKGVLDLRNGPGSVTASLDAPGTLLLEVVARTPGKPDVKALGGAAVDPRKIAPSAPEPADFDAFWKAKLAELATVPANPQLDPQPAGRDGVDYWRISMDNIRGTHVRGQLARPAAAGKRPALLIVQWAGVYPLQKGWVTEPASRGFLTLNILAHDLPIDEPAEFYKQQGDGPLKGYTAIGNDDRETSYFLRMFLSCARAADYLAGRDDWDGRILAVTGGSQGGLQAFVTAGLDRRVTHVLANVPAGCDNTAADAGRAAGWPYWIVSAGGKDKDRVHDTAGYFDGVNFAARTTCPALVGMGLIDTTSRPDGIFAAINRLQGPVEAVVMPAADHGKKHEVYYKRFGAWQAALLEGKAAPVEAWR